MKPRSRGMLYFHGSDDEKSQRIKTDASSSRPGKLRHTVRSSRQLFYRFSTHFHPFAEKMVEELVLRDVAGLHELDGSIEPDRTFFANTYEPVPVSLPEDASAPTTRAAGVLSAHYPTLGLEFVDEAYALYNWEVWFHLPFANALNLSRSGRFEEAMRSFHLIFDPTDNTPGGDPRRFWKFAPLCADDVQHIQSILLNLSTGADPELQQQTISAIGAWRDAPFRPHLVARTRVTAYKYAVVMAYLDNLIAWGDSLFRLDTREAINEAVQYFVLAAKMLGQRPMPTPSAGRIQARTYDSLRRDLDEFGNAAVELETEIPFDLLGEGAPTESADEHAALASIGESLYFCVPHNDKLLSYWDTVGDRLFKIRNSLNLQGVFRQLPLFAPPIDPGMLARAVAAGIDVSSVVAGLSAASGPVRFAALLQKAVEACQELKSLGAQLLSTNEKLDSERYGLLRAKYETAMLEAQEGVRYAQWQEAIKQRQAMEKSIESARARYVYYENLLGRAATDLARPEWTPLNGDAAFLAPPPDEPTLDARDLSVRLTESGFAGGHPVLPEEALELELMQVSQVMQDVASGLDSTGALLNLIPMTQVNGQPVGVGVSIAIGGSNLAGLLSGIATATRGVAGRVSFEAGMASRKAAFHWRDIDRTFQSNAAVAELNQLYKSYRAAELREHIAGREYVNHQTQVEQSRDMADFMVNEQRKVTTEAFYLAMKRELQGLCSRWYDFALDTCKRAERALQFELGDDSLRYIRPSHMTGREGLLVGENLYLDLKRMETAHQELNTRELELTKHISLREWFPVALEQLRTSDTQSCTVETHEALFDLDCPNHYFRRIKTVAVSVACVTGPFAGVHCNVHFTPNRLRVGAPTVGNGYDENDAAYRGDLKPAVDVMVTSTAQSDTGMFESNLRDDRYLPFELAGVWGTWTLTLLGDLPFDRRTISDVVLTIRYTARQQPVLSADMTRRARNWFAGNAAAALSLRHEFPTEWARFKRADTPPSFTFQLEADHFAYRVQKRLLQGETSPTLPDVYVMASGGTSVALLRSDGAEVGTAPLDGSFSPIRSSDVPLMEELTLRFETKELDDAWIVLNWSAASPS